MPSSKSMFPAPRGERSPAPYPHMTIGSLYGTLSIGLNTPPGARSDLSDGVEKAQRLPPYAKRNVYLVDEFAEHVPSDWARSESGRGAEMVSSYFVGVKPGQGMWFDFNPMQNDQFHIAVVPSVQGVNPVTGKPASLSMEQYEKCPVHERPFARDRYCSGCEYKWPKQNYVATTGTPYGAFWLDGFRQADGKVRQWLFTEEALRGVATHVLGDARQYAVAFAIYRSVAQRPPRRPIFRGGYGVSKGALIGSSGETFATRSMSASPRLEVAAGALIDQFVYDDPEGIDFWQPKPVGIIMLNYAHEDEIARIVRAAGVGHNEGPLAGIPVGNP